jgi:hypothetical protein
MRSPSKTFVVVADSPVTPSQMVSPGMRSTNCPQRHTNIQRDDQKPQLPKTPFQRNRQERDRSHILELNTPGHASPSLRITATTGNQKSLPNASIQHGIHQLSIRDANPFSLIHHRRHRLNTPTPLDTDIHLREPETIIRSFAFCHALTARGALLIERSASGSAPGLVRPAGLGCTRQRAPRSDRTLLAEPPR